MSFRISVRIATFLITILLPLSGCYEVPRMELTDTQKTADMYWLFSKFEGNYAPLEYKQKLFDFNYKQIKQNYMERALKTKTNNEFFYLMKEFVSQFKDTHTKGSFSLPSMPNRAKMAYLGFTGVREGDDFVITKFLPTMESTNTNYPLKINDRITHYNDAPLKDIVLNEYAKYSDFGHEEGSKTLLMSMIFSRHSLQFPLPQEKEARITVKRSNLKGKDEAITITVPWIVKDYVEFAEEQKLAAKDTPTTISGVSTYELFKTISELMTGANIADIEQFIKKVYLSSPESNVWHSFSRLEYTPNWDSPQLIKLLSNYNDKLKLSAEEKIKSKRTVPSDAFFIPQSVRFPTYIAKKELPNQELITDKKAYTLIGYMYIDDFSAGGLLDGAGAEDKVIEEIKTTLSTLQMFGVKDLIIDTIDNPGGSLTLGMKIAQAFSAKEVIMPEIQLKVSERWLDHFEQASITAKSDWEKEIAAQTFDLLQQAMTESKHITKSISLNKIFPYALQPNILIESPLNIVILINETCASMCDLFSGIMQDNKMATIAGSQSIGAGGNVSSMGQTPNSNMSLSITESLIVRSNGKYIENLGVTPDVSIDINASASKKYSAAITKAVEILLKQSIKKEEPTPDFNTILTNGNMTLKPSIIPSI